MKCPFKPIKLNKNKHGDDCYPGDPIVAKVITDFGDCDKFHCMAYTFDGKCKMMKIRGIKNEEF